MLEYTFFAAISLLILWAAGSLLKDPPVRGGQQRSLLGKWKLNLLSIVAFGLAACAGRPSTRAVASQPAKLAEPTPFEPALVKRYLALPPTQVLVFGVRHLDEVADSFRVAWLAPILCRLHVYKPDVILTEAMPGEQIMGLDAYAPYHGKAGEYGGPTLEMAKDAQRALRLTAAQALVQATALADKGKLTTSQRRELAYLFVAAAEPFSATVQWLRLPPSERIAAQGISPALVKRLNRFAGLRSELTSLAARLAADLGLERVIGAGDHSSDIALPSDTDFEAAIATDPHLRELDLHHTPEFRVYPADTLRLATAAEVMPLFAWLNSPQFGELDADAQWLAMLRSSKMGRIGRQRVAAWEAQNLHMATAVREATAPLAGGRALLIVGAAHKPFIEAYLRTLTDIELVSAPALLAATPAGCRPTY